MMRLEKLASVLLWPYIFIRDAVIMAIILEEDYHYASTCILIDELWPHKKEYSMSRNKKTITMFLPYTLTYRRKKYDYRVIIETTGEEIEDLIEVVPVLINGKSPETKMKAMDSIALFLGKGMNSERFNELLRKTYTLETEGSKHE